MVVDLVAYSHVQIDRTAVLLDIWSQEVAFQRNKKKVTGSLNYLLIFIKVKDRESQCDLTAPVFQLVDCYMEIYHHVWSVEQKRKIAQVRRLQWCNNSE